MPSRLVVCTTKSVLVHKPGDGLISMLAMAVNVSPSVAENAEDPLDTLTIDTQTTMRVIWLVHVSHFRGVMANDPYQWPFLEFLDEMERRVIFKTHVYVRERFDAIKREQKLEFHAVEKAADAYLARAGLMDWIDPVKKAQAEVLVDV